MRLLIQIAKIILQLTMNMFTMIRNKPKTKEILDITVVITTMEDIPIIQVILTILTITIIIGTMAITIITQIITTIFIVDLLQAYLGLSLCLALFFLSYYALHLFVRLFAVQLEDVDAVSIKDL